MKLDELTLPNKQVSGTFSYVDQIVRLDGFSSEDVYTILPCDNLQSRVQRIFNLYRTAYHEYTHFLDLTTTIYGLSFITKLVTAAAYFARRGVQANPLSPAPVALRGALEDLNRERMHAWHKQGIWPKPWGFRPYYANAKTTIGSKDEYLLIGSAFFDPVSKSTFACAPYSVPAMLESNAVINELFLARIFMDKRTNRRYLKVLLQRRISRVHCLLSSLRQSDADRRCRPCGPNHGADFPHLFGCPSRLHGGLFAD